MSTRDFLIGSRLPVIAEGEPVSTPRPASTVMLVRDAAGGLEVFMLRRARSMAFAASMMVFPGGRVDPRDASDELPWTGPPVAEWAGRLGCSEAEAQGYLAAAVREVFEETGVLLAETTTGEPALEALGGRESAMSTRRALEEGERSLAEVLQDTGLRLSSDQLGYRAHWVTPTIESRRYDTRFFVAELPAGQEADGETSEADEASWVAPDVVLSRHADGEVMLMPPTVVCLEGLAAAGSVSRAMTGPRSVTLVQPYPVDTPDGPALRAEL